jgi:hypothetical protein
MNPVVRIRKKFLHPTGGVNLDIISFYITDDIF